MTFGDIWLTTDAVEKGMAREVTALMGERAPPVSMIQIQPLYKPKPQKAQRAKPWCVEYTIVEARIH